MATEAKVVADSVSPEGVRIATLQLKFHRIILSEFNTHRVFSRNASSSRAIPIERMIKQVQDDPAIPLYWGKNQKGMQAAEELSEDQKGRALSAWLEARDRAVEIARRMIDIGLHKQIANRLLEPWMWTHDVVTSTEWDNFFALRCHPAAQPEMQALAYRMRDAMQASTPVPRIKGGEWHLPYILPDERSNLTFAQQIRCSVARCARVSYVNHDGTKPDVARDSELYNQLALSMPPHMSPLEHQATPGTEYTGNFRGWCQWRKLAEQGSLPEALITIDTLAKGYRDSLRH